MSDLRIGAVSALLISVGVALGGWWIGQGIERFRMADRSITVKGLAEKDVKSDYATWTVSFRRGGNEFGAVQKSLSEDRTRVVAFLHEQGFNDKEIEIRPLQVQDLYAREWGSSNMPLRFNGQGQITVKSARVDAVAQAATRIDPLIQAGIQLSGDESNGGPRYQLRGFNEIKSVLLEQATKNAREQATKFATDAGAALGTLKNANQGVIRVLDDDDGEMESGRTLNKRLRVVSTFEYSLAP
ncbi:MAG: SIMPL domain-containing protein [Candidatus Dactylopiibacterium carminicum]|uniref:SIMPL domain-containing protein n=1 Tax=Candidatus Dactylopiibacterium carminicum TaxID=857335 RepID=A0A272ENM2_9RHOO|nr:SIMPL domain-containing protein [Candidatus Dactylopiibacterium carminicum]KAF7598065.1 SIMPL domain-containing protein [Candidatus Dactylopiibacterium carminicum]PAS91636.1 MAG: SIMPL domain-containing protein [Candidatus Dactylopiibacterium carminicum]PAS93604.1 MAG: SIMPL domain-containing protein [Candidatus Dactylopiibacterium carminicum]PAS96507.1 MAG: SIMPL domain-containing protein [Candidatus Dactylopiibacterium carminicum]